MQCRVIYQALYHFSQHFGALRINPRSRKIHQPPFFALTNNLTSSFPFGDNILTFEYFGISPNEFLLHQIFTVLPNKLGFFKQQ